MKEINRLADTISSSEDQDIPMSRARALAFLRSSRWQPSAEEIALNSARKQRRLKECETLWQSKKRYIEEYEECTWEELLPMLNQDYKECVRQVIMDLNADEPRVILYNNAEYPDSVLANLLRAWYNLPGDDDILLFVNDEAKYAYFICNMNSYMKSGRLLGWDDNYWPDWERRRTSKRAETLF